MMSEDENPFISPDQPELDRIVNIGISDADLRLQKEYSAPFFGGEDNEILLDQSESAALPDIVSE